MANWKKMAEAFGRAIQDPERSREGTRLVREAGERFSRPREKFDSELGTVTREPWTDEAKDVNRAYLKGAYRPNEARNVEDFDKVSDELTDDALQKDFDEAFEKAVDRARYGNRMKELRDVDITNERGVEAIGEMSDETVREELIRRLQDENTDIGDVIEWTEDIYNKYK